MTDAASTPTRDAAEILRDDDAYTDSLIDFVTASPSSYHAAAEVARRLEEAGFTRANGILSLGTSDGVLSSCSVGGRSIDIGWCQQYYPDGDGRQCSAVISNSGIVVSLTCK